MVQLTKTKERGNVSGSGLGDDGRMTDRITAVLSHEKIEGREVHVTDGFLVVEGGIQLDGFGSSPKKGVEWVRHGTMSNPLTKAWM